MMHIERVGRRTLVCGAVLVIVGQLFLSRSPAQEARSSQAAGSGSLSDRDASDVSGRSISIGHGHRPDLATHKVQQFAG